jgi:hypothetical protein
MTVAAAAFADLTFSDRPPVPAGRAGAPLARHLLFGTAAIVTTGVAVVGVALTAGWLLSASLSHRHGTARPSDFGLRRIALAPAYPSATKAPSPADIVIFPPSLADAAVPVHVVDRAPLPRERAPVAARANAVPLPPAAPPELASLRTAQNVKVAALPPPPQAAPAPASEAHIVPPHADKPAPVRTADSRTAVYDIAARAVYLPNGTTLEAHSGLGDRRDDPRYVNVKNNGPTPPNTYYLSLREELFHGVRAIRLTPVDDQKMFGRAGMLAHTYMLGPQGDSNGCVSFKDYPAFLQAYLKGDVDRLVVVTGNGAVLARSAHGRGVRYTRYAANDNSPASLSFSVAQK